jgi:dihydroxy-acid dehydratase
MLCGIGMQEADIEKAQIGITSVWFEGNTCNMHLIAMARSVNVPLSRNA